MLAYTIKRLIMIIPVLWGIATIIFFIMFAIPGDPAKLLLGQSADPQTAEIVKKGLGLDKPVHIQYLRFLGNLAKGDLGRSYRQQRKVTEIIAERFPATFKLAVAAVAIAVIFGVSAGILASLYQNTFIDSAVMVLALIGVSTPVFWLGLMLILLFASTLGILPVSGYGEGGDIRHLILPAAALSSVSIGYIARMTRSSMLEVVRQDYIRTASAKGLSKTRVMLVHALKNASIPIVTIIGMNFAGLLGGAVATETVFAWPGLGRAMIDAVRIRDVPVVEGGVIFLALVFVLVNLLVDLSYAYLDPRIRYD